MFELLDDAQENQEQPQGQRQQNHPNESGEQQPVKDKQAVESELREKPPANRAGVTDPRAGRLRISRHRVS
jgi:hypothetical protein